MYAEGWPADTLYQCIVIYGIYGGDCKFESKKVKKSKTEHTLLVGGIV